MSTYYGQTSRKSSAPADERPIRAGISNDPFGPDLDDGVLADTVGINGQRTDGTAGK